MECSWAERMRSHFYQLAPCGSVWGALWRYMFLETLAWTWEEHTCLWCPQCRELLGLLRASAEADGRGLGWAGRLKRGAYVVSHSKEVVGFSQESTPSFLILTTTGRHPGVTMPSWPPEHPLPIPLSSCQEDRSTGRGDKTFHVSVVTGALLTLCHALLGGLATTWTAAHPAQPAALLQHSGSASEEEQKTRLSIRNP